MYNVEDNQSFELIAEGEYEAKLTSANTDISQLTVRFSTSLHTRLSPVRL